jgi:nucleotide-binding universal stress UspA family protein
MTVARDRHLMPPDLQRGKPMIKTILVPATGSASDLPVFAAALDVARRFCAHLRFLHVCIDPVEVALAMTSEVGGATLLEGLIEKLEQDSRERETKARRLFAAFCAEHDLPTLGAPPNGVLSAPSAQWHVETGQDTRWAVTYGMTADLSVAGRSANEASSERSMLEALLLETGRPLLIPGSAGGPMRTDKVAIAWKATPPAARAITAAMPLLAGAAEIIVMSVEEEGRRDGGGRLAANLAWHGFHVVTRRLEAKPEDAAPTLLAAAAEEAGLLVMGGYGHSRLREWVFGGFTQRVLREAAIPVLIMH